MIRYKVNNALYNTFFLFFRQILFFYNLFFYPLNVLNIFMFKNKLQYSYYLLTIVSYKKTQLFFKKNIKFFNFFKLAPLTLKTISNQSILPVRYKLFDPINESLVNESHIFDKKKLKKRLLSVRRIIRYYYYNNRSTYQLTKWLKKFKTTSQVFLRDFLYYRLVVCLKRLMFLQLAQDFVPHNITTLFYVNRTLTRNPSFIINKGDIIESLLSFNYFFYNLQFVYIYRKNAFKYAFKSKLNLTYKESFNVNKHVFNINYEFFINFINDFEVDYISGTCVLIKKDTTYKPYDFLKISQVSAYQARLYNWGWEV